MNYDNTPLIDNEAIHNFEITVEDHRAFIDYLKKDGKIYLVHTEVPAELEGKGVAAALVEKVFRSIEAKHLKIVPLCPYVQHYLKRHPDWQRIVA
ncbi:GNAT family N-acetyltransferase [Mucilaginibacter sp. AW1-3]